jgi:hypothetical protein
MSLFERTSLGLKIVKGSFKVLRVNPRLLIFPLLSGMSLFAVFAIVFEGLIGTGLAAGLDGDEASYPLLIFGCYLVGYFVIVFFNMSLIHCVNLYFEGEEVTIGKGLRFGISRIRPIFVWALFAATIGTLLRLVQNSSGRVGRLIATVLGLAWGVTTFFVVPIIAYEKLGPVDAVKRSAQIMKNKWGESLVASFSFSLLLLLLLFPIGFIAMAVASYINDTAGALVFGISFLLLAIASGALNAIFVAAVYKEATGNAADIPFDKQLLGGLFGEAE